MPTVVFSHPVIGTIGYTEDQAKAKYGEANIKVYNSSFVNLWYGPYYKGGVGDKPITKYKLIVAGPEERVVGLHCIGMTFYFIVLSLLVNQGWLLTRFFKVLELPSKWEQPKQISITVLRSIPLQRKNL